MHVFTDRLLSVISQLCEVEVGLKIHWKVHDNTPLLHDCLQLVQPLKNLWTHNNICGCISADTVETWALRHGQFWKDFYTSTKEKLRNVEIFETSQLGGWLIEACSTQMCVLQKVPFGGFSECERAYYGLNGLQKHSTVVWSSSQETNSHQRASSPRSDKEMQPSSASGREQITEHCWTEVGWTAAQKNSWT